MVVVVVVVVGGVNGCVMRSYVVHYVRGEMVCANILEMFTFRWLGYFFLYV